MELDGELVTPGLERCGIEGVLRAVVLREAQRGQASPVRVADIPMSALAALHGAWHCPTFVSAWCRCMSSMGAGCTRSEQLQELAVRIEALDE